jgi:nucleotide-binding universal stress UspA family protein
MYKHILIASDGSELATKALEHGPKRDNAEVTVITVTEPWSALDMAHEARRGQPDPIGRFEGLAAAAANRILDDAAQRATTHGVACNCVYVKDRHPAEGIDEVIE